jgi:hypothetical protein
MKRQAVRGRPFACGDWVEVKSEDELLATLDEQGTLDGLPFMPEMRAFSGRRHRVSGRAGRICVETAWMRRMDGAVFLDEVRCDGSAHDQCQRGCVIFWRDQWLKRVSGPEAPGPKDAAKKEPARTKLTLPTRTSNGRYWCQSTALIRTTQPFGRWDFRPYITDIVSGNITLRQFMARSAEWAGRRLMRLAGRRKEPWPTRDGPTPGASGGLQPGDWGEVKSREEILATLDAQGRNRGLGFEMAMLDHCGRRYRVLKRIEHIILEATGEMRTLRDTVALEHLTCPLCPRKNQFYWREIWLRRIDQPH